MSHTTTLPLLKEKINYFSSKLGIELLIKDHAIQMKSNRRDDIYTYIVTVVFFNDRYEFEYEENYLVNVDINSFREEIKRKCPFVFTQRITDNSITSPQLPPKQGDTRILDLVLVDLVKRAEDGKKKYGTYLQAHNGRDALIDLYQELLDACMYIRQLIEEGKDE